jgi:hypothetical protein
MVVVANPILEPRRRSGRLDATDQPLGDQDAKGVVDRLERDGSDPGSDDFRDAIGGDVGLTRDRAEDRQSLGGDLDPALAKEGCRVRGHAIQ